MNQSESTPAMSDQKSPLSRRNWFELLAIMTFVLVNLLAPVVCGELFPFTVSPMFSDQPKEYCTYEVLDSKGSLLDPERFGLHLVYDGNPPGLGMGIVPTPTLHEFGEVRDQKTVVRHVRKIMNDNNLQGPLTIKRMHVVGGGRQLVEQTDQWIVDEAQPE